MRRRRLFVYPVPFVLLIGCYTAVAQEPWITDARVTWYGVYQAGQDKVIEDKSSFTGIRTVSTGIVPPKVNSDRIPAILNSRFGFGFVLSGTPMDAGVKLVKLRFVRNFPADGITDPKTGERRFREQGEYNLEVTQREHFCGYIFDRNEELVPGLWSLEVWYGNRKLVEKSFTVYEP
jgi:hypothetical protein